MLKRLFLAAFLAAAPMVSQAGLINIDPFDGGSGSDSEIILADIFMGPMMLIDGPDATPNGYGERTASLARVAGNGALTAVANPPVGEFSIGSGNDGSLAADAVVGQVLLSYLGAGVDFTDGGTNTEIQIVISSSGAEANNSSIKLVLFNGVVPVSMTLPVPTSAGILHFDFAAMGYTGDLITQVDVIIKFDNAADFNINSIFATGPTGVVPEPASMILGLTGFAGLGLIRRRKK